MTYESSDTIVVNLLKDAVESEGCYLSEVDIDNLVIKINVPGNTLNYRRLHPQG